MANICILEIWTSRGLVKMFWTHLVLGCSSNQYKCEWVCVLINGHSSSPDLIIKIDHLREFPVEKERNRIKDFHCFLFWRLFSVSFFLRVLNLSWLTRVRLKLHESFRSPCNQSQLKWCERFQQKIVAKFPKRNHSLCLESSWYPY